MSARRVAGRSFAWSTFAFLLCASISTSVHAQDAKKPVPDSKKVLISFRVMYGVDGPFIGDRFAVRGIEGDELPWEIERADGSLTADGHLKVNVRGLVFADDPSVPPGLRGTNDEAQFRAAVSCLTEDGPNVVESNVITRGFPATKNGDSTIEQKLKLPDPCVAPIVMVLAGSEDKWFAINGFESE